MNIALFLHVFGVLTMFGAVFVTYANMLGMLFSNDTKIIKFCSKWTVKMDHFLPFSVILILGPAIYLVVKAWGWKLGWIDVSLVALILMTAAGPAINLRKLKEIYNAVNEEKDATPSLDLVNKIRNPLLWNSVSIMTMEVLAIVFLMILKPEFLGSVITLGIGVVLGLIASNIVLNLASKTNSPTMKKGNNNTFKA